MPLTELAGLPYLAGDDAPDIAGGLEALAASLDNSNIAGNLHPSKVILTATSQADRDTRYAGVQPNTLVACAAAGLIWLKTSTGWLTVSSDTGWVTTGFVAGTDCILQDGMNRCRIVNGLIVEVRVAIVWDGADIVSPVGGTGNIGDRTIITVPSGYRPSTQAVIGSFRSSTTSGSGYFSSNTGGIVISDMTPGNTILNGHSIQAAFTFLKG